MADPEQRTPTEIIAILGAAGATITAALAALYKYLWPIWEKRAAIRAEQKQIQARYIERQRSARAREDIATDKRISEGLKYIIQTQADDLTNLEKKCDAQQQQLMEALQDRAALRAQVAWKDERIAELEQRLRDNNANS